MAPRRGAEVVQEPQLGGLNFNQPISWKAGKPIPTAELLRRLDALSNELREMDQEETDKDSLTNVAKELAAPNLLSHKDKGVRAFTACCLVDVLKLCAPDAPFTPTQLKDIFTLFITSILPALSDPSNAYNTQHKYVLVSLSEVKSIVLLMDIPNSEPLTLHLFGSFFDTISGASKSSTGESIAKDVEYHMSQMLVTLVDEAASLPTQVVDIIVAQFLRASSPGAGSKTKNGEKDETQSTLLPKELPEAYNMAQTVCNLCPEKMSRYIAQYFNDVVSEITNGFGKPDNRRNSIDGDSGDEGTSMGPSQSDLKELDKAHNLLRELWRASPSVLQNVIPLLEAELSASSIQLRVRATETLGDIISGIGAAGPPPPVVMDPAAYPPIRLGDYSSSPVSESVLLKPRSPHSFPQTHPTIYQNFLNRRKDKWHIIRSKWTTAVGRILITSAGGIGLSREDENTLVQGLGEKLVDADEKVRLAAVKAIAEFSLADIMSKLAPHGDVDKPGSILGALGDRARDLKKIVREEAMTTLARIWGVAAGEIAQGNEAVTSALGNIPSKIFDAYYANDMELNVLLDRVVFEQLIPLKYPPKKQKGKVNGNSAANGDGPFDPDKIRTERILLLVKSLTPRSKKAFFSLQGRQAMSAKVMESFVKCCEQFNGGVMDENAKEIKAKLDSIISWFAKCLPDPLRTTSELNKYAKLHDRRSYQLLKFAIDTDNDFRTVHNSINEFSKRIGDNPHAPAGLLETMTPLIYRSASLLYNKSHLPAILQFSRTDENGLGAAAHEINHEISEKMPQIFKSNVKELCSSLTKDVPSETRENGLGSVETLRACAQFAKSRAKDFPKSANFTSALKGFALYGTPPKAAKYAVSILMASTERKEMYVRKLMEETTAGWSYGEGHFLSKLAALSQLVLFDLKVTDDETDDRILDITTKQIIQQVRSSHESDGKWRADQDLDEECQAKCWAIKILVNRLRAVSDPESAKKLAVPVFRLLNTLIHKEGEISKEENTPAHHKSRLRLLAAQLMLKLCTEKKFDEMLTPTAFERLAFVTQDPLAAVRRGFVEKIQKYLVRGKLPHRFYTIIFLTAFEPDVGFKSSITTWIRSRAKEFQSKKARILESCFPRLLSLLAHHPDYSIDPDELKDHARYILFYLTTVSSDENLALIYKYAERVKQARDAIKPDESERLYVLSDLSQSVIRKWEAKKLWKMETWPVKVGLAVGLFAALPSHEVAQEIAEKDYLPDMDDQLDALVRSTDNKKRRKIDNAAVPPTKKVKTESKPRVSTAKKDKTLKTPAKLSAKRRRVSGDVRTDTPTSEARRKSGRGASARKSYADRDSSEDDEEMMDGVAEWTYENGSEAEANGVSGDEEEAENEGSSEQGDVAMNDVTSPAGVEEEEPEPTPPPPRSNKRKSRSKAQPTHDPEEDKEADEEREPTPPPPRSARGGRSKAIPKAVAKETDQEAEAEELEASAKTTRTSRATKGKGRAKAKPKEPSPAPEEEEQDAEMEEKEDDAQIEEEQVEEKEEEEEEEEQPSRRSRSRARAPAKSAAAAAAVKSSPAISKSSPAEARVSRSKSKGKEPVVKGKDKGKASAASTPSTRGKGKRKATKDVFDMDEDE